jgi:hypothetical protein
MSVHFQSTDGAGKRASTQALWQLAHPWWMFLVTGIAQLLTSMVGSRFPTASAGTMGVLMKRTTTKTNRRGMRPLVQPRAGPADCRSAR